MMQPQPAQLDEIDLVCTQAEPVFNDPVPTTRPAGSAVDLRALQWRVIADRAEMMRLGEEWSDLADSSPGSLFVTPEWVQAWLATIGQDVQPRIVTARARNDRTKDASLVALWPLGLRRTNAGPVGITVLEPLGETLASGDRLDPLTAGPGMEQELIRRVREVAQSHCDLVHWGELRSTGRMAHALRAESGSIALRTVQTRVLPRADLPATYDEFTARLGKKLRGHVRRQEQIALQQHGLCWRLNDEGATLASAVQQFAELHQKCWRYRGKNGNLAESRFLAFIQAFTESAWRRGWLRLHRLCAGERTVAALLAFHHNGCAYYYQSGWDPSIAKLSPGSLCVARAVRTAIEEGITLFDFLRGDEPYKRRWANQQDETVTLAEAATFRGRAVLTACDAKEMAKSGIVRLGGQAAWEKLKACLQRSEADSASERGECL